MGAHYKNFEIGGSSQIVIYFILAALAIIALYVVIKLVDRYKERRKLKWFYNLVEEKGLSYKQTDYLKRIVLKNNIKDADELIDSVIRLDLPKHIRVKLIKY